MKGATFIDKDGRAKKYYMGCYGIGIGRTLQTIAEIHHDDKGIIWPESIAPYQVHLLNLQRSADEIYDQLTAVGIEGLYDDRADVSAGVKFADADLIGIPVRLVVSPKTKNKIGWKDRTKIKTITSGIHININGAIWLLIRFRPDFSETGFAFVPAGETYENQAVDSDPTIIHVDPGMGQFDHHQLTAKTAAAELVFNYLKSQKFITLKHQSALERLVKLIVEIDNFDDCFWPESSADRYDVGLSEIINNLKISGRLNDKELVYQGLILLDAAMAGFLIKIKAEAEIGTGEIFTSRWGKSLAVESKHSLVSKLAQKMGFSLVVRKEPKTGFVSIKSQPKAASGQPSQLVFPPKSAYNR